MQAPAMEFAARALAEDRAAERVVTLTGRTIAHYEVMEKLGEGGMGVVYRGRDTRLNRQVAIKVLPTEFAEVRERLVRFERELRILATLNHSNIAAVHGLEESEGKPCLILVLHKSGSRHKRNVYLMDSRPSGQVAREMPAMV